MVLAASRISTDKAEDAGGLSPVKDDNAEWRDPAQQIMPVLGFTNHWFYSSTVSSRKLTGRNPSLQEIMADFGFFIQPS